MLITQLPRVEAVSLWGCGGDPGPAPFPWEPAPDAAANAPLLAAMGVVPSGCPTRSNFRGLERAPAQPSAWCDAGPVCGVLIGAVRLHEPMTPSIGLGVLPRPHRHRPHLAL